MAETCKTECPLYQLRVALNESIARNIHDALAERMASLDIKNEIEADKDAAQSDEAKTIIAESEQSRDSLLQIAASVDQIIDGSIEELRNIADVCPGVKIEAQSGLIVRCEGFSIEALKRLTNAVGKAQVTEVEPGA